jgi:hypothetical protein
MAWPYDTAEGEHVQGLSFLLCTFSIVSPVGKWHGGRSPFARLVE